MQNLGHLAVRVKPLHPTDSLGKAAEIVRSTPMGATPVVEGGRLVGLVTASLLADFFAAGPAEELKELPVSRLPMSGVMVLPDVLSPSEALMCFQANEVDCAPVVDAVGGLVGMVPNAELVSAVCRRVRPPMIGGMATPFGVYLTGGGVRGGVGDLALMTTGIFMAVVMLSAGALTNWLVSAGSPINSLPGAAAWLNRIQAPWDSYLLFLPFAVLFRLSWVSGFHAAEHQVVHTIEAGDELRPEVVREKPRVHPRCGTNLVTVFLIMTVFWNLRNLSPVEDQLGPLVAIVVTFLLWRRVGGWIQQHVTTRPASPGQIENGIAAGRELIDRYQDGPVYPLSLQRRIWNMGLLQVMAGWLIVLGLGWLWSWLLPGLMPPALRGALG